MQNTEMLKKSIDQLIDEVLAAKVEKSMDHLAMASETADKAIEGAPASEKDEARGAGRPKQISEIPQTDEDGKRAGEYDADVTEEHGEEENAEAEQVKSGKRKKEEEKEPEMKDLPGMGEAPEAMEKGFRLSKSEYAEFVELKKAREATVRAESLRKAKEELASLIKSAVNEATADIRKENEALRKSLVEQSDLIKAMASKPKAATAITSMSALEKGGAASRPSNGLSKSELVDLAERLVKSNDLMLESAIELDQTGYIVNPDERAALEKAVRSIRR